MKSWPVGKVGRYASSAKSLPCRSRASPPAAPRPISAPRASRPTHQQQPGEERASGKYFGEFAKSMSGIQKKNLLESFVFNGFGVDGVLLGGADLGDLRAGGLV